MTGIVKAVTKKLQLEDRFKILVVKVNHFELQSSYMEQTLVETLLEILSCIAMYLFDKICVVFSSSGCRKAILRHVFAV